MKKDTYFWKWSADIFGRIAAGVVLWFAWRLLSHFFGSW